MSQQHRPFDNDDNDDQPSVIDNDNHGQGNLQRAALRSSTIGPTEHHPQHFSSVITSSNDHVEYSSNPTGVGTPSVSAYTPSQSYPHQEFHTYADEQVYYGYGRYADGDSQDTVMYMQSHSPPSRPAFFDDDEEEGEFVGGQTDGGHGAIVDDRHQSYHNSSHTFDQDPNNPLEGEDEDVSRTALFKSPPHFAVDVPDSDEDEVDSAADGMGIGTSFNRRPVHMPTNTTSSGAGPAVVVVADERASAIPPSLSRRTTESVHSSEANVNMNNEEAAIQFGSPPPLPVPPRTRESSTSGHIEHSLHPQSHLTQTQAPLLPAPATYSAQPIPSLDFHNNPRRHIPHSSSIPSNLPHPSHIPPSSIPMQSKPIPSPSPALHGHSNTPSHSAAYPSPASSSGNVPLSSSPRGVGVVRMGTPLTTATTTTATTSSGMGTPSGNSSALPLQVQRQYRVQEQEGSPIPTSATATLNAPIQQPSVATLNTTLPASGTTLNLVSMNPGAINTGVMVNVGTNNPNSNGFQGNMEGLLSPLLDVPVGVPGVVVNRNYPSRNGSRSRRGDQDVQGRLGMQQAQLGNVYESGHSQGQAQGTQQVPVQLQGQGQGQERRVQDQGHTRSPIIPREPNMLESFSRTMRSYIPNIPIPIPTTAAPSPPLVSRPVSFGSFMTSTGGVAVQQQHIQDVQQLHLHQQHQHQLQQLQLSQQQYQHVLQHDGQREHVMVEDLQAYQPQYYQPQFGGIPPPPGSASPAWGASHARSSVSSTTTGPVVASPTSPTFAATQPIIPGTGTTTTARHILPVGNVPDPILWSRWDTFTSATVVRRLLIIGYLTGIQVWDCTELKSVREVLNLDFVGRGVRNAWGDERGERDAGGAGADGAIGADESGWDGVGRYPLYAAILPDPFEETGTKGRVQGKKGKAKDDGETEGDGEVGGRPYLGLIMYDEDHEHDRDSPRGHTTFVVYSLAMNRVVKCVELSRPQIGVRFVASERFVVISTARPPMIHVLSATTLESLFIIPSAALIPFAHKLGSTSISSVTSTTASNANEHGNSGSSDKTNNNNNISRNHKNIVSVSLNQDLDATLHPYSSPIITATSTQQHLPPPSGSNRYPQYSQAYPGTINQLQPLPAGIVNQPQLSSHSEVYHYPTSHPLLLAQPYPEPIFAFSGRLLAFASVTPSSPLHHTQHIHPQQHQPPHQQHQGHSSSRVATPISPTSAVSSPRLVAHRGGPGSRPSSGMASGSPGVPGSYGSVAGVPGSYGSSYGYPTSLGSNSSAGGSYGSGVVAGMTSGSVGSSIGAGVGAGGGSGFVGGLTSFTTGLSGLTGISGFTNMGSTQQQVQAAGTELGSAALKVGGSMLSGVKTLGGFAYSVAKSKALGGSGGVSVERGRSREGARGGSGDGASFFSKSAPTGGSLAGVVSSGDDDEYDESGRKERRFSSISATGGAGASASGGGVWDRLGLGGGGESASPTGNGSGDGKGEGYYVTVLDLGRRATSAIGHAASSNGSAPASSSPAARNTPLTTLNAVHPTVVHEFRAVKRQPVAQISFSDDGNSLVVAPKDGQNMLVFGLKPSSSAAGRERWSGGIVGDADRVEGGSKVAAAGPSSRPEVVSPQSTSATTTTSPMGTALPSHVYDLKRGRTSGVVEGVGWAKDGRWVAIGTRNRTVHVFSVNPYGGPPDVASHVEGRVRNVEAPQLLSTEVSPLVRLRPVKSPTNDQLRVPLSFVFVNPTDAQLPPSLLPPSSPTSSHGLGDGPTSSTSAHPNARSTRNGRSANYQDVLLFDPADGSLSLRRFTLEVHSTKEGRSALTSTVGASMSTIASALPGRLNSSPSTTRGRGRSPVGVGMGVSSSSSPRGSESPARGGGGAAGMGTSAAASYSGLTRMMDAQAVQLVARDSVAATWNLQRRRDWKIVLWAVGDTNVTGKVGVDKKVVDRAGSGHGRGHSRAQSHHALHDWLAQAELSTCSRSPHMLPRTIYLIHRFMFRTLGEDYHALIRRYQFDLAGPKINVRKEIEISAHGTGTTEAFIEGFSSSPNDRHTRRHSSAFDEPLATALAGALEYTPSPAVLPMLPNGAPGKTFIPSVPMPIRSVAGIDVNGVGESLGRIRRGVMHKVRSPPLLPRPDSANRDPYPISLEFDEEDEDFLYRDDENSKALGVPTGGRRKDDSVAPATSRSTGGTAVSGSVSTAATSAHLLDIEGDHSISVVGAGAQGTEDDADWHGWDTEDKFVVEEVERFDNISAVGFLDEEQERVKAAAAAGSSTTKQRRNLKKQR